MHRAMLLPEAVERSLPVIHMIRGVPLTTLCIRQLPSFVPLTTRTDNSNPPSIATTAAYQQPTLLSIAPELRNMIY